MTAPVPRSASTDGCTTPAWTTCSPSCATPREPCGQVLLIGHNPGVQQLVLALAEQGSDDARALAAAKYPTSALAVLDLAAPWADVSPGAGQLSSFAVPRG